MQLFAIGTSCVIPRAHVTAKLYSVYLHIVVLFLLYYSDFIMTILSVIRATSEDD
jgi:hypothetical protein